jgi:hypothetical protein
MRENLGKIGAPIVCHGHHVIFQLAEVKVLPALFVVILHRIDRLPGR